MTECIHHWLVESPCGGKRVRGECKKCGAVRSFASSGDWQPGEKCDFCGWEIGTMTHICSDNRRKANG